jgi:hypothetical protein
MLYQISCVLKCSGLDVVTIFIPLRHFIEHVVACRGLSAPRPRVLAAADEETGRLNKEWAADVQ